MSLELFAGNCWNIAGKLLEPAGNWSSPAGTLVESRCNLAGTVVEQSWNLPGSLEKPGTLLESHWNIAGTLLEPGEPLLERGETLLEPCCWNLWLEQFAGNQCGCRFVFSFYIASCFA